MLRLLNSLLHLIRSINIGNKEELLQNVSSILKKKQEASSDFFYVNSGSIFHMLFDRAFMRACSNTKYIYLNSFPLGKFIKLVHNKNIEKLNAEDFIFDLFKLCETLGKRVFLLGSDSKSLEITLKKVKAKYSTLNISGYHGYFNSEKSPLEAVNRFKPDILLVGLGLGKQELWVFKNKNKIKIPVIITIGNFIDILGESRGLPPAFCKKYKIEWLYRIIKEPRRLWKRYVFGGIILFILFIYSLFLKFTGFFLRRSWK